MSRTMLNLVVISVLLTVAALGTWLATGAHPYTKYQDVVREEVLADEDDPFAEAGLYDGETVTQTVKKEVFYFGLLPTPQGLFDKHALSVVSVVVPVWLIVGGISLVRWRARRRRVRGAETATTRLFRNLQ